MTVLDGAPVESAVDVLTGRYTAVGPAFTKDELLTCLRWCAAQLKRDDYRFAEYSWRCGVICPTSRTSLRCA
jgi:hypothetical protein